MCQNLNALILYFNICVKAVQSLTGKTIKTTYLKLLWKMFAVKELHSKQQCKREQASGEQKYKEDHNYSTQNLDYTNILNTSKHHFTPIPQSDIDANMK